MYLLHIGNLSLIKFVNNNILPYVILLYITWRIDYKKVTFKNMVNSTGNIKANYRKIWFCEK